MPTPKPSSQPSRRQVEISLPASSRIAIAILTALSAGLRHGTGSLKNTMIPSPENWSSVPSNWLTRGPSAPWYSRRKSRTSLGFGGLGEGGIAAQVTEHHDNLEAVAFKDLLIALRNDH